jgi:hypothetical protein
VKLPFDSRYSVARHPALSYDRQTFHLGICTKSTFRQSTGFVQRIKICDGSFGTEI